MAKKEKKELTPEQLEAKKIKKQRRSAFWTKFWAVVVALALVGGICGIASSMAGSSKDQNSANSNQVSNQPTTKNFMDEFGDDTNNSATPAADTNSDNNGETPAADNNNGETPAADNNGGDNQAAPAATDAASVADIINKATADAVSGKVGYTWHRTCNLTQNIDVGGATSILNGVISAVAPGSNVNSVVGGFLGVGDNEQTVPKGQTLETVKNDKGDDIYHAKMYTLWKTSLKAEDLQGLQVNGNVYSFTLANASSPQRDGSTPMSRFTNDFLTYDDVKTEIANFTSAVTVESANVDYSNIQVKVKIDNGKLSALAYSYDGAAKLNLKVGISIAGSGAMQAQAMYSNFQY